MATIMIQTFVICTRSAIANELKVPAVGRWALLGVHRLYKLNRFISLY